MRLSKWQALGNDYLLVEPAELTEPLTPELVERLCDYHYGVGSDGVLELVSVDGAAADLRIWNPDGSTAALPLTTQVQQSYDLVNLNFTIFRDRWQYRAYVNNVLDDAPYISFDRGSGESSVTTIRPRTIGVGVRVGF